MTDFALRTHPTICFLQPLTADARAWVLENLPGDAQRWAGAVVIESRFIEPVLLAIKGDGLEIATSTGALH